MDKFKDLFTKLDAINAQAKEVAGEFYKERKEIVAILNKAQKELKENGTEPGDDVLKLFSVTLMMADMGMDIMTP